MFSACRGARFAWGVAVLIALFAASAPAQIFPGRVSGSVRDVQGGAIAGAEVKLAGRAIGFERIATTDATGYFNFPELPIAEFELTVTKQGFKTLVQKGIITDFGKVNEIQVGLQVGDVATQVEVSAAPPMLQTETNTTGGLLVSQEVSDLPIGNRDYTRLALVLPGTVQNNNFSFSNFSINGSRSRSSSFNIDGAYNTDGYRQLPSINQGGNSATAATRLSPDAIEEVNLVGNAGAELGQSSGGVMNAIIKSGTNQFHGTLYELHRDRGLNARNFFENLQPGIPKAGFVWNEFGFTAGGPIVIPGLYNGKDRTFIFGGYDESRTRIGTTFASRAPTDAQVQQALSLLQGAQPGFQPNPLGLKILDLYKPLSGQFVSNNSGKQKSNNVVVKADHRINSSDSVSARYLFGDGTDTFPQGGPGPGGGSQLEKFFGVTPIRAQNAAVSEVHIFSPALLNTFRLAYNRSSLGFLPRDSNFDPASIGLNTGVTSENFGLPEIDVGSGPGRFVNLGINPSFPRRRTTTTFQLSDDVSYTRGAHGLKFGVNWFQTKSFGFNNNGFRGLITFNGSSPLAKSLTTDGAIGGLIDLLSGTPTPGRTRISRGSTRFDVHQNVVSFYASDTYKLTNKLTVVAGLRYEFFGVPDEDRGRFSNFLPDRGLVPASGLDGGRIFDNVKTNWAPRISVAYAPFDFHGRKTVFRASYGIYHDITPFDILVGQTFNIANTNPGLATNPIGNTGVFSVTPSAPIPFGPGVPIFGTGAPQPPFDIIGVDPNLKPQNAQNWTFNVQQELSSSFVLELGYVGTKGTHLFHLLDANQPTPGDPATADQRRPFATKFPTLRKIDVIRSVGNSSYNSLQLSVRSRNFHGLTTRAAFTWSHNIDEGSETLDFFGTSGFVPQDSNNLRADRSESTFDQRKALILSYVYELPHFAKSESWGWSRLLNGWQVSGVTTFRDGLASPILTFGNESGTNSFHERPNCIGPRVTQLRDFSKPYVVSGFAEPAPGTFGNCPRNPVVGPGLNAFDISVAKDTTITERVKAQIRVDFFNAFNHPNFAQPTPVLGSEFITGTADEGSFDSRFGVGGPRNIQLNLKFIW